MAKNSIRDYSATASQNTDINSINIDENCPASNLNNSQRALMAHLKNVSTGAVNLETPAADRLDVDNIRIDGNTISSTDANGDIILDPNGTGVTAITGGFTATDGCTITTADNDPQLTLVSTDADGSEGPRLDLRRDSGSPADGDILGTTRYTFDNDAGEVTEAVRIEAILQDASDGTEDAKYQIEQMFGGGLFSFQVMSKENSQDINFRVESDNDANALFIEGGDGSVGVGLNNPSGQFHVRSQASEIVTFVEANASSYTGEILYVQTTRTANTTHRYFKANENGGAATSIQILGNGNVQNANNSYGATSDQRIKQDVTDANSQWNDIKALNFKNYKEKYRVSVDGDDAPVLLGLIAQDLEAAGMNGLIEHLEPDTYQKDTLGITDDVKAIKYSVLYMKAVKALQEAMARIETLETEMTALKARVTALEA